MAPLSTNLFPPDESKLISIPQPGRDEIVVDKDRFCAFSGNDLKEVLRSGGIKPPVMAGASTSGVILIPRSATVATVFTVDQWIASLPARG